MEYDFNETEVKEEPKEPEKPKKSKNVKEKIAVSNIRKEFDMKENNRKKIIYGITSSAAVVVLGFGIVVGTGNFKNTDTPFKDNIQILISFADHFFNLKLNDYFSRSIIYILKHDSRIFYEYDIREKMITLKQTDFKECFIQIINNFSKHSEKEFLKRYGKYE